MADIFVISDTHFGHENILKFKASDGRLIRPFNDVTEMDELMIQNWNKTVTPQDKVYHLGDVALGSGRQKINYILSQLNGKKRLILGNHDHGKDPAFHKHFHKISMWRMFSEFGLLLTHVPVHPSTLDEGHRWGNQGMVNVHGHIHFNPSPEGPYKCVCVEQVNYTPVSIEELRIR